MEKLEKSEKHSRSKDGTISPQCEHCLGQLEKTEYLMKTLSKFTLGRSNLDVVLGSQRSVLNKEGIGYSGKFNPLGTRNFLNMSKPTSVIAPTVLNLVMHQIPAILKIVGFLKESTSGYLKEHLKPLTWKDPSSIGYLHLLFNLFSVVSWCKENNVTSI